MHSLPPTMSRTVAIALGFMLCSGSVILAGCGVIGADTTSQAATLQGPYVAISLVDGSSRLVAVRPSEVTANELFFCRVGSVYMLMTEVTAGQWQTVMGTAPWNDGATTGISVPSAGQPATNLSWSDAQAFSAEVSRRSGKTVRLMRKADFSAAIGTTEYPWGDSTLVADAKGKAYVRETSDGVLAAAVSGAASPQGLYGLVGNIREWTAEGALVGGSYADNLIFSGRSEAMTSIPTSVRHPLSGCRLVLNP